MSALPLIAAEQRTSRQVRFVPNTGSDGHVAVQAQRLGTGWRNIGTIGWQSPTRISPTGYA
jgi:hypothetical protein